jgi:hypothetical protein
LTPDSRFGLFLGLGIDHYITGVKAMTPPTS